MSEPKPDEPDGWRQPEGRQKHFGVFMAVIAVAVVVAILAYVLILTLATYG